LQPSLGQRKKQCGFHASRALIKPTLETVEAAHFEFSLLSKKDARMLPLGHQEDIGKA
jgi:hypothetical protein